MAQSVISILLADQPVVKAAMEAASAEIAHLRAENARLAAEVDVWEDRYNETLAEMGGTWPS